MRVCLVVYTHLSPLFGFNTLRIEHAYCKKEPDRGRKKCNIVNKRRGKEKEKGRGTIREMQSDSKLEIYVRVLAPLQ